MYNTRQFIEYFHLLFLDHLGRKIDKRLYLLIGNKSTANFKSDKALENLFNVTYQDFQSQVVAYLDAEQQKTYSSQEVWQQIVISVKRAIAGDNDAIK